MRRYSSAIRVVLLTIKKEFLIQAKYATMALRSQYKQIKNRIMSMVSDCCGASTSMTEYGLCPDCMEHCDFYDDEEDYEDEQYIR